MELIKKVTVYTVKLKDEMKYKGTTILSYSIEYPRFSSIEYARGIRKINEFYEKNALDYQKYIRTSMFNSAKRDYENSIKNNYPVHQYEAMQVYKVTFNQSCTISLYMDRYEYTGGAHGSTVRSSQTWNVQTGRQIALKQLFPNNPRYVTDIKAEIIRQIKAQISSGNNIYFENYVELVNRTFNQNSFYLTPHALVIYFQQYDIAPYASGLPEFTIPYYAVDARKPCCKK